MTTTVVTRSKTTEQDARIAHAQRRLPLTSRSLSGEEELTITSSDISRTLPALSQPIFAKAARKQVRWGLSPESRIEMVNAARKGPLTSDLLRCFLFRFYSPKPALWVGEYVQMRSANSDGSWETAKDEKFLTVRIDKVQCGKKDGFAFGKTLAYWRYQVSYPTPGKEGSKARTTVDKWDLELGMEAELDLEDGPGVLPTSSIITNDIKSMQNQNPFAAAYGPKSLSPPSTRVEQPVARRTAGVPNSPPRKGSFFDTHRRSRSDPNNSQSIYSNVRVHQEKPQFIQPALRVPSLYHQAQHCKVIQMPTNLAQVPPASLRDRESIRGRIRSSSDLTGYRAPSKAWMLMPRQSPEFMQPLSLPSPEKMLAQSTLGRKRSYSELEPDQRDMVELPGSKSRRIDLKNLMSEGERSSPVKFSF